MSARGLAARAALALAGAVLLPGCVPFWLLFQDPGTCAGCDGGAADADAGPPSVDAVEVPEWPPLGPNGAITVRLSDDQELASLTAFFRENAIRSVAGTTATVELTGPELGEGLGTLTLEVSDWRGATARREVTGLLVDLTPPEITPGRAITGRDDDDAFTFWVGDAWVLGDVEVEVGGRTERQVFEEGFPSTLGEAWDESLVRVPTAGLGEGDWPVRVTASDAAGNTASFDLSVLVDGTPPEVTVEEPLPNASVPPLFLVRATATDALSEATLEVTVGGAPVVAVEGAVAEIVVDASEFVGGPLDVEVTAIDAAGNRSPVQRVAVEVEAAPEGEPGSPD